MRKGEIDKLTNKIQEHIKLRAELEEKLEEAKTANVPMEYEKQQLVKEKEILENQNQWLNEQLKQKSDELLTIKTELVCIRLL